MDLTERRLGRIEACLWGIEEATRNTNQTAYRLARGIAEQLQEAETDGQAEEDLRADLRQEQTQGRIPDWRDGEGAERNEERGEMKAPSVFLCEQVRAYGRALMHNGVGSWLGVLRGIMREFEMDQKTLGALLGIKTEQHEPDPAGPAAGLSQMPHGGIFRRRQGGGEVIMATLKDNRKYQAMTVSDADSLFLRIARLKAVVEKETATHKKKLAELEEAHKAKLAGPLAEKEELEAELTAYILANPERFEKPRKHPVGQIGSYGITTDPAFITITDKKAVIEYALEQGYDDLCRVERVPDKDAVLARIQAGEKIPGAAMTPAGDVAKISWKKGWAEQLEGLK